MSSFSFPFPRNLSLPLRSLSPRLSLPLPRLISLYLPSSRLRFHCVSTRLMASLERKHRIAEIASSIRVIPDFPKPGVMFQDITTLLLDPKAFGDAVELFVERYRDQRISVVAGGGSTTTLGGATMTTSSKFFDKKWFGIGLMVAAGGRSLVQ
ncbi:hypothetical protein KFK09_003114 [Dendrobium nobile]|uniref:adenine phosphoribosyltransferase n=1 Tax=Dendrobium nobile TaxID=94219 RepID=A0A8T3C3A3_DENNO|nr:hypothetical protein KFK09_003114 [Dendrobium nobile]